MAPLTISSARIISAWDKFDLPAQEAFDYEAVRFHTDGSVTPANATNTTENNFQGIAVIKAERVGRAVTVVRGGLVDVGNALDAMAFGAPVFLSDTDGAFDTAAGTTSVIAGRVHPIWNGSIANKVFKVEKE
jgi:hypothetical protein